MLERTQLRPLGVGDIVDRVFVIYRASPLLFLVVSAIPYLVLVLLVGVAGVVFARSILAVAPLLAGQRLDLPSLLPVLVELGMFVMFAIAVALIVSLVQSAALLEATAARYLGRETTIGRSLEVGVRATPRLFGMGLLALLALIGLWLALFAVMGLLREWYVILIAVCGGLAATFFLTASWMVSPAIATLEGAGPIRSLQRSWQLSGGHRWRILGLIVLLLILQIVLSALLGGLLVFAIAAEPGVRFALQQSMNLLITIAWAPVYWGTFAVLYYDLRVRKEAYDLELAAEALPREA